MPSQDGRQRLFIPADFGSPARYDPSIFPLLRVKGNLHNVDLVLEATLDEIYRICHLAGNRDELQQVILEARQEYDK